MAGGSINWYNHFGKHLRIILNNLTTCNTAAVASLPLGTLTRETLAHGYKITALVMEAKAGSTQWQKHG